MRRALHPHLKEVTALAWSPNGSIIASASTDKTIQLRKLDTGNLIKELEGHSDEVRCLAWSPDGQFLASGSADKTIRIWNLSGRKNSDALISLARKAITEPLKLLLPTNLFETPLEGHRDTVTTLGYSSDGRSLASGSLDGNILIWDIINRKIRWRFASAISESACPFCMTSIDRMIGADEDGRQIGQCASCKTPHHVSCWKLNGGCAVAYCRNNPQTRGHDPVSSLIDTYSLPTDLAQRDGAVGHKGAINSLAWSPNGTTLATGASDRIIILWDTYVGQLRSRLVGHTAQVTALAWSPDGQNLVSASNDRTIHFRSAQRGWQGRIIEGHTDSIVSLSFSNDGRLFASRSLDNTVRLWNTKTLAEDALLEESSSKVGFAGAVFHPTLPLLATLAENDQVIHIWDLEIEKFFDAGSILFSQYYSNAKVVLLGDTGVGKSGLALVLAGQHFEPTESTHARRVWAFDSQEVEREETIKERHETLLWDLAGQSGYRLIHQLHLNEVAVALVVFDARSETDPFAGIRYWDRALRQAQRMAGDSAQHLKKFLVAARADRGGIAVSRARIDTLLRDLEFDGYFETSAKEGWNIKELATAIRRAIDWERLPTVSSTELFNRIKSFLIAEKEAGRILTTEDELYRSFRAGKDAPTDTEELRAQFKTCIGRVESRDLIRRLSFGNLILLQPELLDAYASAIINAAKEEPDGFGSIAEEDARNGRFRMSDEERIRDKAQEQLLLIVTVEDLLRYEIALREQADEGTFLVFPSQLQRENPDLPDPEGKALVFTFEGPILNIYTTLAVRLAHSGFFKKPELWKNAATYVAKVGGTCGIFVREIEEGRGELTLFFDKDATEQTRFEFEEFTLNHLQRRALADTIKRRRVFVCNECNTPVTELAAQRRRERGFDWIDCNVCGVRISLLDREERLVNLRPTLVREMDRVADTQRNLEAAASILQGKRVTNDYDVFISYSHKDKIWVHNWLIPQLEARGIYPYIDSRNFEIGIPVLVNIERAMARCPKTLLVMTPNWVLSEWTTFEGLLLQSQDPTGLRRKILPVMLEKCDLPPRLSMLIYADFTDRLKWDESLERIVSAVQTKSEL